MDEPGRPPYLIVAGRHQGVTQFQSSEIWKIHQTDPANLLDRHGRPLNLESRVQTVVLPITSINHGNTRRNPVPGDRRFQMVQSFADSLPVKTLLYGIDDVKYDPNFAQYILTKIWTEGGPRLTPEKAVVGCSTPSVAEMWEALGFQVLPFEEKTGDLRPWDLIERIVSAGKEGRDWRQDEIYLRKAHPAMLKFFDLYSIGERIQEVFAEPLGDDGDLTETRDYNTYARSFDWDAAERKYAELRDEILQGRIVDFGSCTGALLMMASRDPRLRESDLFGFEISRWLHEEAKHRKEQGAFENPHVFLYRRDAVSRQVFPSNSVDTIMTTSMTHEVDSYLGRLKLLQLVQLIHEQLRPNGRWLNLDVCGPENKDEQVWMQLRTDNGRNHDYEREFHPKDRKELKEYLDGLNMLALFKRFARDFRKSEGETLKYETDTFKGKQYVVLRLEDACEFRGHFPWTDNWMSECHERFCRLNLNDWKGIVEPVGFSAHPASHSYLSEWQNANRFAPNMSFYRKGPGGLTKMEQPHTNVKLVLEKQ